MRVLRPAWEMAPVVVVAAEGVRPAADQTPGGHAGTRNEQTHPIQTSRAFGEGVEVLLPDSHGYHAGRSMLGSERCARQSPSRGRHPSRKKSTYSLFPEWQRKDRTPQLNRQSSPCFIRQRKGVRGGGGTFALGLLEEPLEFLLDGQRDAPVVGGAAAPRPGGLGGVRERGQMFEATPPPEGLKMKGRRSGLLAAYPGQPPPLSIWR